MKLEYADGVVAATFWGGSATSFNLVCQMIKLLKDEELVDRRTFFKFNGVSRGHFEMVLEMLYKQIGFLPKAVALEEEGKFVVVMSTSTDFQIGSTVS